MNNKKKIVIGGKAYADIDVLACISAYTQLLTLKKNSATGIITGPWNQTIPNSIKNWPISIEKSFADCGDDCDFILVDLSDPHHMEDFVIMDNITHVYDHHYGYEKFWKERLPHSSYIEPVGACATLIWEKYKENNLCPLISKTNANLLYTAIFANTLNFKARITTERDRQAAQELSHFIDLPKDWISIYYHEVSQGFSNNLFEHLLKDTKTIQFKDLQFLFGQIEVWNAQYIRPFKSSDLPAVIQLFKEAVAAINIRHYSPEQIAVWTDIDPVKWQTKLENMIVFVAEIDSTIVGFADMTREGYFDHLYVHKDYQARWVSLHLFKAIEKMAKELGLTKITTDCSITAKVPAERMGFKVIKEQIVEKKETKFINYHMEKKLSIKS